MNRADAASFDEFLAGGIFSSPETRTNLEILCDDFGSCFAGTPGEEEAARFLESKLREYGLENVRTEPFEYNGWTRGAARLSMTSPRQRDLESLSMPMAAPGLVRGRVVDLGYGAPEDFEARRGELPGNIALVAGTNPPGAGRWIHRIEKYNRSVLAGAAGFIWTGHTEGVGPFTGAVGFNCWGLIPAVMVSLETGLLLRRLIGRHGAVEAEIGSADVQERKTSWNIIGDTGGGGARDDGEMVVIGNHYDGHDISQGAEDPKSGLVAALDIARALPQCAGRLDRRVRFVLFGVEELGLIGAHAYVDTHPADIAATRFMFNLDAAGGRGAKGLVLYGPDTLPYFRPLAAGLGEGLHVERETSPLAEPPHLSADHYPFVAQGVPCGFIRDPDQETIITRYYHTPHDTVDKLRLDDIRQAAFLCARLAWRVANAGDWPRVRPDAAGVARAQAEYDASQVSRQLEAEIEELRKRRQSDPPED